MLDARIPRAQVAAGRAVRHQVEGATPIPASGAIACDAIARDDRSIDAVVQLDRVPTGVIDIVVEDPEPAGYRGEEGGAGDAIDQRVLEGSPVRVAIVDGVCGHHALRVRPGKMADPAVLRVNVLQVFLRGAR